MTAADEGQERWRDPRGEDPDLRLEGVDRSREFADPGQQIAGEAGDRLGPRRQVGLEGVEDDRAIQRPSRRLVDPELDEEPAEPLLVTGPVDDEVLAMIDQQPEFTLHAIESSGWQIRLTKGGPSDRQGVDRVALARLRVRAAGAGHELGRNPDDALADRQQVDLEPTGQVAAVLEGPRPIPPAAGPAEQLEVSGARRRPRPLGQPATGAVGRPDGVGA